MRGRRRPGRAARSLVTLASLAVLLMADRVSAQVPPDARYRTFDTDHFRVIYSDGLEGFARRAAASAEWAYAALSASFIEPPPGRISLVISDHSDFPNASATPFPSNRITLIATPQIASRQLNNYNEWLDVSLVHELTHIFHLDHAAGIWRLPRAIFGRAPPFFPAFHQPTWVIEGLATYHESRLTGAGRIYGGYFHSLLTAAAARAELVAIDAANGVVPEWPAGSTPYAYGGLYFKYLATQHGDTAVASFARHGGARLPYTLEWAARPHFGHTLSAGWTDWEEDLRLAARTRSDSLRSIGLTRTEPLTDYSWSVPSARFSPDGRYLAFTFDDPRDDPATIVVDAESAARVARHRRNSSGSVTWSRDGSTLYVDQVELADRYRLFSDLYVLDAEEGRERRLTRRARLIQADVSPDGRLVAVEIREGTNRLVRVDSETGRVEALTAFDVGINWGRPRVSPNGDLIAVERWVRGTPVDIALLDSTGSVVAAVTADSAVDMAPAWSPTGRHLLWSSDRDGVFEIYAVEIGRRSDSAPEIVGGPWRVTRTLGGAFDPEVSPDGGRLVFTAQHPGGFRLERTLYDPHAWEEAAPPRTVAPSPAQRPGDHSRPGGASRPYSPFPSLWPRAWLPLAAPGESPQGWLIAATLAGTDDVRRHAYALLFGWRTGAEDVEALAGYSYAGLGDPVLRLSVSQQWDGAFALGEDGSLVELTEREREARVTASFLRPRVRRTLAVTPSIAVERLRFFAPPGVMLTDATFTDLEARLGVGLATARSHSRSLSTENGFVALADVEHERLADDLDRWRLTGELELRGYLSQRVFGFADHVMAARLALGASEANERGAELFDLGGVPGRALDFGSGITVGGGERYALRGYSEGAQLGDRVGVANVEYRFPLALVGRGYKLWPLLLQDVSAALFLDAGSAWSDSDHVRLLASTGIELSTDWGLGYSLVYRFRAGLARRLVTGPRDTTGWEVYLGAGVAY